MFDEFVFRVANSPDLQAALPVAAFFAGGLLALFIPKGTGSLSRSHYFAYFALIILVMMVGGVIWLIGQEVPPDAIWIVLAAGLAWRVAGGVALARIAAARSRDGFGHGGWAFIAFIPLVNLILLAKPAKASHDNHEAEEISQALTARQAIIAGFVALAAAAFLSTHINRASDSIEDSSTQDSTGGIEETLALIALGAKTPIKVGDAIEIVRLEAAERKLRRVMEVDLAFFIITSEMRDALIRGLCHEPPYASLLRAGATIEDLIYLTSGTLVGAVETSQANCSDPS